MANGEPLNSTSDYAKITEADLLARMIYSEAGNQSEEGKRGCAFVAQNRLNKNSSEFGKTMYEVLTKAGQFKGLETSNALKPDTTSQAWKECIDIASNMSSKVNPVGKSLWFCTHKKYEGYSSFVDGTRYFQFPGGSKLKVTEDYAIGDHTFFCLDTY